MLWAQGRGWPGPAVLGMMVVDSGKKGGWGGGVRCKGPWGLWVGDDLVRFVEKPKNPGMPMEESLEVPGGGEPSQDRGAPPRLTLD